MARASAVGCSHLGQPRAAVGFLVRSGVFIRDNPASLRIPSWDRAFSSGTTLRRCGFLVEVGASSSSPSACEARLPQGAKWHRLFEAPADAPLVAPAEAFQRAPCRARGSLPARPLNALVESCRYAPLTRLRNLPNPTNSLDNRHMRARPATSCTYIPVVCGNHAVLPP